MSESTAIIVEDNTFMSEVLRDMLKTEAPSIEIIGVASTGNNALELLQNHKPDILFLDIELPDMTGFELLSKVGQIKFKVIFTTAHSQYAIKAFRFNALDYLVKPIKEDELKDALSRVRSINTDGIQNALQNLEARSPDEQRLVLPTQSGTLYFPLKEIMHLEGERNYSFIHLADGRKELSSKNLAYFEDVLKDKGFFRCHRSFLINRAHSKSLNRDSITLTEGSEIPVARRKKGVVKSWFHSEVVK